MHISPIYIQKQDHSCIFLHLFMQYFFYLNESDRPSFKDNLKKQNRIPHIHLPESDFNLIVLQISFFQIIFTTICLQAIMYRIHYLFSFFFD